MRAHRISALLSLAMVLGCAALPGEPPPPTQAEQAAFDAAMEPADPEARRAALEEFLSRYPDAVLEPEARLELGDLEDEQGDVGLALASWRTVVDESPRSAAADAARLRIARAEYSVGNLEEARSALSRLRFSRLSPEERRDAYRVQAALAEDPVVRVRSLAMLRGELVGDAEEAEAADEMAAADETEQAAPVDEALLARVDDDIDIALMGLDASSAERLSRQLGDAPPAARVWLLRAEFALDAGDLDAAEEALQRASKLPLPSRYAARLAAVAERLRTRTAGPADVSDLPRFDQVALRESPSTRGARGSVGVVLPLSGPFARFGEESLHGVMLAADLFGAADDPDAPSVRLLVRDTAGDPARAEAAVRELAADDSVVAIVGPLLSAECEAAAGAAEELGVPLLTLTAREEIAQLRPFVFRLRTRPVEEAQLLVDKARELGGERFAILYRDDPYGRGLRALFWDAVEARGGSVVAVSPFDPESTDFADPIRRLVGYTLLTNEEKALLRKREGMLERARRLPPSEARALRNSARSMVTSSGDPLPPIVDFDFLFIAESYENVVLIAPQLAFHEVFGPRLLGPDGWYHPDLVRVGRENVEGAIFVAHYFPESPTPFVAEFADHYAETFSHESNVFAAQAYDATNLVLVQLARGRDSREAVRDGVLRVREYPGVAGVLSMRSDGNATKRPFLIEVEQGEFIQLD